MDALRNVNAPQISGTVRLLFASAGDPNVVLAVMAPSQDQVGRKYPIVVFALVPASAVQPTLSTIPMAFASFYQGAASLVENASRFDLETLKGHTAKLFVSGPAELGQARQLGGQVLTKATVQDLHSRIFGELEDGRHFYAYHTFLTAVRQNVGRSPNQLGTVVDCPIRTDVDLFAWLDLTRRLFPWRPSPPSYFWSEANDPRLLVTLGRPPLQTLQFLADPQASSDRLWPLFTTSQPARITAAKSMGPALARVHPQTPIGELLGLLTQRAQSGM
jgi:type VI secretion system protein ImpM